MAKTEIDPYSEITVNPEQAVRAMIPALKADVPILLYGQPGVGKSSIVRQLGAALKYDSVVEIIPTQDEIIDFKFPFVTEIEEDGRKFTITRFAYSDRLPRHGRHIIFVDELPNAPPSMQPSLYSLILDRKIGDYTLPPDCPRIAAGNRETDGCFTNTMSVALRDRFGMILNIQTNSDCWLAWASRNNIRPEVMAFVKDQPYVLTEGICHEDVTGGCTPRSLERLSRLIDAGIDRTVESQVIRGCIGRGAGVTFAAYLDIFRSQIDLDKIIQDPENTELPTRSDIAYSICYALAHRADSSNFDNILKYVNRLPSTYSVVVIKDVIKRNPKLAKTKTFAKFTIDNHDIIAPLL